MLKHEYYILLNTIKKVKEFSADLNSIDSSIDVDISIGRYTIDARSLMGIFSLNLSETLTIKIHTDEEVELDKFKTICSKYEVTD